MSLGITTLWRVRPQQRLGLLIPREPPLLFNGPPTCRFTQKPLVTIVTRVSYSNTAGDPSPSGDEAEAQAKADHDTDRDHVDDIPTSAPIRKVEVGGRIEKPNLGPRIRRRGDRAPNDEVQKLEESLERSKFSRSILVEPFKTYPHKQATRESWRDHYKSVSAQAYFHRSRQNSIKSGKAINRHTTDWRRVLGLLAKHTHEQPKGWIEDGIKIELPERAFKRIVDEGGDIKIGAIRRRTGAYIKASRAEGSGDRPLLLLSGSRQAINRATEEIRNIAGSITITRLPSPPTPGGESTKSFNRQGLFMPPLSREEGGRFRRFKVDYDISTIPWPDPMSHLAFEKYVASLTDSVILPHLDSEIYSPTKYALLSDHERAVARQLQDAFTRRDALPWTSCSALKLALSFLCEKGDKYLPEARSIFVAMDQHGLFKDVDIFNILLKAPTKTRNLQKFQQTLLLMIRRGFAPNLDTWMLFLRMVKSVEVRSYILQAMHMKNLLGTPKAIQRVAEEMARFDADHALMLGKSLDTFIQEQDERYGPDWLTRDAGNQLISVLCRYRRYSEAFQLLKRMHLRAESIPVQFEADAIAARPNVTSFNTIMSVAKEQGKLNVLGNTLRLMKTVAFATQPDRVTLHLLFETAWHLRMRTTISVIWRYASLARLTTWRMRQRVAALLAFQPDETAFSTNCGITLSAYRRLGGENLAHDLAGGKEALDKIRSIVTGHSRSDLAVFASKVWPTAFDDFGPTVSLASSLTLAASRDWAFFQAQKEGQKALSQLRRRTKPKILPLGNKRPSAAGWVDLARLDHVHPDQILPEDKWESGWDELRDINVPRWEGFKESEGAGIYDRFGQELKPEDDVEEIAAADGLGPKDGALVRKVTHGKEMLLMDPKLWANGDGTVPTDEHQGPPRWSLLQNDMEQKILAALGEMEEAYLKMQKEILSSQDWDGTPPVENCVGEVEGVMESNDATQQEAPGPVDSGGDHPMPVLDDVTEGPTGFETQDKRIDDEQEANELPEVLDVDIVKRSYDGEC
ncbi:hypothetical protein VSDG_04221 [Cytospora chrysosperma]|uniref:K Homology domain-containing protein n=1 Tax=Cytospora chrysosperma TaxID=252740 RepID=A0A423W5D5_CYTCH|nr:hypothetical protein VSDG_04221 [Valsa sordida]